MKKRLPYGLLAVFVGSALWAWSHRIPHDRLSREAAISMLSPNLRPLPLDKTAVKNLKNLDRAIASYKELRGRFPRANLASKELSKNSADWTAVTAFESELQRAMATFPLQDMNESPLVSPSRAENDRRLWAQEAFNFLIHSSYQSPIPGRSPYKGQSLTDAETAFGFYSRSSTSTGPRIHELRLQWRNVTAALNYDDLLSYRPNELQRALNFLPALPSRIPADESWVRAQLNQALTGFSDQAEQSRLRDYYSLPASAGFDSKESLALTNKIFGTALKNLSSPWKSQDHSADALVQRFEENTLWFSAKSASPFAYLTRSLRPYTHRNALGQAILTRPSKACQDWVRNAFLSREEYEGKRLGVALLIYKQRHKQGPPNLEELVREHILPAVPIDPYSGRPFLYQQHFKPDHPFPGSTVVTGMMMAWSVGENGVNDHADYTRASHSGPMLDLVVTVHLG